MPHFAQHALSEKPLTVYGDGSQQRCFGYVGEVVGCACGSAAVGQIFNIGNTEEVSILELAKRVIKLANSSSTITMVPYDAAYEGGFEDVARRIPDLTRVKSLIGYQPKVGLDEIITRIAAQFRETATGEVVGVS